MTVTKWLIPDEINYNDYNKIIIKKIDPTIDPNSLSNIEKLLQKSGQKINFYLYGTNFSKNYPTQDERTLIFETSGFKSALPPGPPINNSTNLNPTILQGKLEGLKYIIDTTELNSLDSNAVIIKGDISFNAFDTLSAYNSLKNDTGNVKFNIANKETFTLNNDFNLDELNNLNYGTFIFFKQQYKII